MTNTHEKVYLHTVAVHEAGHAVAAYVYKIPFDRVVLRPAESRICTTSGLVDHWNGGQLEWSRHPLHGMKLTRTMPDGSFVIRRCAISKRVEDYIVMILAGREAEDVILGKSSGYSKDYKDVHALIKLWLAPTADTHARKFIIERLRPRAARLMHMKASYVKLVAVGLNMTGTLSEQEVRDLCQPPSRRP